MSASSRSDVFVTMPDGVRLAATLYLPESAGPWPALLEALPYRKDDLTASWRTEYERLAAEFGYAVCRLDLRGTGSSEGDALDEYTTREHEDVEHVIGWLAEQDWCAGSVGMYGTSWSGFNSLQVAMRRPPGLRAICSIFASDDRYADDVHYYGGALKQLDLVDWPTYMEACNVLPPVPRVFGDGWEDEWERRLAAYEAWTPNWFEHPRYDDYWKHGSLREDYTAIEAPTMLVTGWADGYTNIGLRAMASMRCPRRLLAGPWAHAAVETSRPGPNIDLVPEMVRWWDRWLKDLDNGVDREPPIVLFVRRATPPAADLETYPGEWRFEPGWPLDRSRSLELHLGETDRDPSAGAVDELRVRGDVGWTAWISCAGELPWGQPQDQRPDEAHSLVYDWAPLHAELEILGYPLVRVAVRSSAPVAYLSAKVCDVHPDGTSQLVTRGLMNLAHRRSREDPTPLEPGVLETVSFELDVASWRFEAGHRIRLDLAGSDWPNTWPPPEPVVLEIDPSASALVLPTLEGPSPIAETPVLLPPPPSGTSTPDRAQDVTWRVEHDPIAKETRAVIRHGGSTEADEIAPAIEQRYEGTVGVSTEDPGRAWVDASASYTLRFPEAVVSTESRTRVESDAGAYHVRIEIEAARDGEPRWSRVFERRVPRDLQ